MKVDYMRVVDYNELFAAVRKRFPDSEAENCFIQMAEDGAIRKFYAPNDENDDGLEDWEWEMFTTLKEEIGMNYGEVIGVEIYY